MKETQLVPFSTSSQSLVTSSSSSALTVATNSSSSTPLRISPQLLPILRTSLMVSTAHGCLLVMGKVTCFEFLLRAKDLESGCGWGDFVAPFMRCRLQFSKYLESSLKFDSYVQAEMTTPVSGSSQWNIFVYTWAVW